MGMGCCGCIPDLRCGRSVLDYDILVSLLRTLEYDELSLWVRPHSGDASTEKGYQPLQRKVQKAHPRHCASVVCTDFIRCCPRRTQLLLAAIGSACYICC